MHRIFATLFSGVFFYSTSPAQSFTPDAKVSSITFTISNFGVDVKGVFTDVAGKILFSETNPDRANFDIRIETNSITTGITLRDNHLKNENYFNIEKYPRITFRSTEVRKISSDQYLLIGNLSIKGKTKVVSIPFQVSLSHKVISFVGSLVIDRRDYGIGKNSLTMGDEVRVQLRVVANPDPL